MSELIEFADGGYAFLKGVYPYSQGVIALNGFALERARFARPLPLAQGFAAIESQLAALGRPRTALCAAELRSPRPFSFDGFGEFNRRYVGVLEDWGIFRAGLNPVARSNVAPELDPPAEPSFYAFCYTVPVKLAAPSFVVAGSGEWPEGGRFPEDIVARGDTSPAGLRSKARWVLDTMQQRLRGLGTAWADVSATQAYTVHDLHPFLGDEVVAHGAAPAGLTWHYCRPPISGLEYEMDARGIALARVIRA
ncbi:MAG: 2-amino-5-chloromuconate deaminase CnbZ [Burkholderiales bacterium]